MIGSVGAFLIVKHTHAVSLNVHGTHYDHTCERVFVIVPSVQRCREDSNSTDTTEQDIIRNSGQVSQRQCGGVACAHWEKNYEVEN